MSHKLLLSFFFIILLVGGVWGLVEASGQASERESGEDAGFSSTLESGSSDKAVVEDLDARFAESGREALLYIDSNFVERERLNFRMKYLRRYARINSSDAMRWVEELKGGDRYLPIFEDIVVKAWAVNDLKKASEFVALKSGRGQRVGSVATIARQYGENLDINGAVSWISSFPLGYHQSAINACFNGIASEDVELALRFAERVSSKNLRFSLTSQAYNQLAMTAPEQTLLRASELEDPALRYTLRKSLLAMIARTDFPLAVAEIEKVTSPTERETMVNLVAQSRAKIDIAETARWYLGLESQYWKAIVFKSLARDYARVNPDEAIEWSLSIPDLKSRDEALVAVAQQLSKFDFKQSMKLVEQISDPELKRTRRLYFSHVQKSLEKNNEAEPFLAPVNSSYE